MPQPIRFPDAPIYWGADALERRPLMALRIASIAAEWTYLENNMALAFGYLLGEKEEIVHEIYHGFFERGIRDNIFSKLAKRRITPKQFKTLTDLQKDIRRGAEARNRTVHGSWAASDKYPSDLMLMGWHEVSYPFYRLMYDADPPPDPKPTKYTIVDLNMILNRINALQQRVYEFGQALRTDAILRVAKRADEGLG